MRVNNVSYSGIVRKTTEQNASEGSLDELINLRIDGNSLKSCGKKEILATGSNGLEYYKVIEHYIQGTKHYIGIRRATRSGDVVPIVDWFTINNGSITVSQEIAAFNSGDDIDIKTLSNILIITSYENKTIYSYNFRNNQYNVFYQGVLPSIVLDYSKEYVSAGGSFSNNIGTPTKEPDGTTTCVFNPDYTSEGIYSKYSQNENLTIDDVFNDINAGMNFIRRSKNKYETEGWVGVTANFTLFDGTETKPTQPVWFYLGGAPSINFCGVKTAAGIASMRDGLYIGCPRGKLKVFVHNIEGMNYNIHKDIIKEVNIYCTAPISGIDLENSMKGEYQESVMSCIKELGTYQTASHLSKYYGVSMNCRKIIMPTAAVQVINENKVCSYGIDIKNERDFIYKTVDQSQLGSQTFYLQKSIPFQSDLATYVSRGDRDNVQLDFSNNIYTYRSMVVENSGYIKRYGKVKIYNGRMHLFDMTNKLTLQGDGSVNDTMFSPSWEYKMVTTGSTQTTVTTPWNTTINLSSIFKTGVSVTSVVDLKLVIWTRVNGGRELKTVRQFQTSLMTYNSSVYLLLKSYPCIIDSRSYRVDMYVRDVNTYYKYSTSLKESTAYDYRYLDVKNCGSSMLLKDVCLENYQQIDVLSQCACLNITGQTSTSTEWSSIVLGSDDTIYTESDTVVVSGQNNPVYFAPQNSYCIGEKIVSLDINSTGISDVQIGQYPIYCFTVGGIYGMQVGSGEVLYSNVFKVAEDECTIAKSVNTTHGTVFLKDDGLYLLTGRTSTKISSYLDGEPDFDIRQAAQFSKAHQCTTPTLFYWGNSSASITAIYTRAKRTALSVEIPPVAGDYVFDANNDRIINNLGVYYEVKSYTAETTTVVIGVIGDTDSDNYISYVRNSSNDINKLYNVTDYLSVRDFRKDALLTDSTPSNILESSIQLLFDEVKDELIVSINPSYRTASDTKTYRKYSYVYGFTTGTWHKISETFNSDSTGITTSWNGSHYLIKNIKKETYSEPTMCHMQTRALKLGSEGFKYINRAITRVNINNNHTEISNGNVFSMYVYASRDMKHWTMIGSCQRSGYTDMLQIAKTSGSYKYFIVSMGGYLDEYSEIGYTNVGVVDRFTDKER